MALRFDTDLAHVLREVAEHKQGIPEEWTVFHRRADEIASSARALKMSLWPDGADVEEIQGRARKLASWATALKDLAEVVHELDAEIARLRAYLAVSPFGSAMEGTVGRWEDSARALWTGAVSDKAAQTAQAEGRRWVARARDARGAIELHQRLASLLPSLAEHPDTDTELDQARSELDAWYAEIVNLSLESSLIDHDWITSHREAVDRRARLAARPLAPPPQGLAVAEEEIQRVSAWFEALRQTNNVTPVMWAQLEAIRKELGEQRALKARADPGFALDLGRRAERLARECEATAEGLRKRRAADTEKRFAELRETRGPNAAHASLAELQREGVAHPDAHIRWLQRLHQVEANLAAVERKALTEATARAGEALENLKAEFDGIPPSVDGTDAVAQEEIRSRLVTPGTDLPSLSRFVNEAPQIAATIRQVAARRKAAAVRRDAEARKVQEEEEAARTRVRAEAKSLQVRLLKRAEQGGDRCHKLGGQGAPDFAGLVALLGGTALFSADDLRGQEEALARCEKVWVDSVQSDLAARQERLERLSELRPSPRPSSARVNSEDPEAVAEALRLVRTLEAAILKDLPKIGADLQAERAEVRDALERAGTQTRGNRDALRQQHLQELGREIGPFGALDVDVLVERGRELRRAKIFLGQIEEPLAQFKRRRTELGHRLDALETEAEGSHYQWILHRAQELQRGMTDSDDRELWDRQLAASERLERAFRVLSAGALAHQLRADIRTVEASRVAGGAEWRRRAEDALNALRLVDPTQLPDGPLLADFRALAEETTR